MNDALLSYYRVPETYADFSLSGELSKDAGYFRFGSDTICYGKFIGRTSASVNDHRLDDALQSARMEGSTCFLPFDPTQVITNLRYERYLSGAAIEGQLTTLKKLAWQIYYLLRPGLPIPIRKHLQRAWLRDWRSIPFPQWPVDRTVDQIAERLLILLMKAHHVDTLPFIWFWPDAYSGCAIMTHDVEQLSGLNFCNSLMDINDSFGIKSSFQLIPEERYRVSTRFLDSIRSREFEINIHDLNHDGRLYTDRKQFLLFARKINQYAREYGAHGFRSGALYRNVDWYDAYEFSYDMSVPNVGHLDAQRGGCCTVMPYFIGNILEIPVTTIQDYSLFHILGDYSIDLWKRQISLILEKHGLVSFIIHPDYILEERERNTYTALLGYLSQLRREAGIWMALPMDVDRWWRDRNGMRLVREGESWRIEGSGKERAMIAYAQLSGDHVSYTLDATSAVGRDQ